MPRMKYAGRTGQITARQVQWYHGCDGLSGPLLLGMATAGPWLFGTTQPWSIRLMTGAGLLAGILWLTKVWIRRKGYRPARWDDVPSTSAFSPGRGWIGLVSWTRVLGVLSILFLGLMLVSAWNARAHYDVAGLHFQYQTAIAWLPSSLESRSTWFVFGQYLGLTAVFWSMRDWMLGYSAGEWRARHGHAPGSTSDGVKDKGRAPLLPARLRWLLWALCLNGAILGIEGIAQRMEGSGRLLFLVQPEVNPGAVTQFGPWAYRANAAQYFNLLWPVSLGFWWSWQRGGGSRHGTHHLLLIAGVIMASCPVISTSRGGALITFGLMAVGLLGWIASLLLWSPTRLSALRRWGTLGAVVFFYAGALWLGLKLGWPALEERMTDFQAGLEAREQMFDTARPMAEDYPWFGTGAGTFGKVFQLYRGDTATYWPAELHNDWLELRITLGRIGLGLLLLALGWVWIRWWLPGGIRGGRRFVWSLWLAQAGCLVHARWDFPFQIHSIVFLFVVWTAVLACVSRR
jgi:O-antigen ligase